MKGRKPCSLVEVVEVSSTVDPESLATEEAAGPCSKQSQIS